MNARAAAMLHRVRDAAMALGIIIAAAPPFPAALAQTAVEPVDIRVPRPFAIELGARHRDTIRPDESPLADLLGAVFAGAHTVSHDLVEPARIGITRVTFSAWSGAAGTGAPVARLTVPLLVLPYGQTPIGESLDERATASNNATRVLRDDDGTVHVAWLDASADRYRVMYRRGARQDGDGTTLWNGPAQPLDDATTTPWNAYVAMARWRDGVIVAWQGRQGVVLRRIVGKADLWRPEAPIATGIAGAGPESSVSLATHGDAIAMLTPGGLLARSADGGVGWRTAPLPVPATPAAAKPKAIAMDLDRRGNVHVAFALPSDERHWSLHYVRHQENAGWTDAHEILADAPEWRRASDGARILADFPVLRVDARDGIHVAWHGTANTRDYGKDEVFYRYRPAENGAWGGWRPIQSLWPNAPALSQGSFAPVLSLDATTGSALAVTFFVNERGHGETGARLLQDGVLRGGRIFLSRMRAEQAVMPTTIWFPSAAPTLHRPAGGGAWIDVLQTVKLPADFKAAHAIVHQSVDIERLMRTAPAVRPGSTFDDLLQETETIALAAAATLGALLVAALTIAVLVRRRQAAATTPRRRSSRRRGARGDAGQSPR